MVIKPFPDNDINRDEAIYVREIQEFLRTLELSRNNRSSVPVDGIYGPMTTAAVENFQRQYNLQITGVVDRQTYYKIVDEYNDLLARAFNPTAIDAFSPQDGYIIRPGDTGDAVVFLNTMLRTVSVLFQNVPRPEGYDTYSETTESAVKAMQKILGLPATGVVNRLTWNGITNLYNDLVKDLQR